MKINNEKYPYKILFVEDEDMIRQNYVDYLKIFFEDVYEAKSAETALLLYKEKQPDIMIVDIHLPGMSGIDFLRKIRENDFSTKAIMLTAYTDKSFLLEATSLKLIKYLTKPISRKELQEALHLSIDELKNYKIISMKLINLKEDFTWNVEEKELKKFNKIIDLTQKERDFLSLLLSQKNKIFSYDEIFFNVWKNFSEEASFNALKNLVTRLRKKLPKDLIINIFNEGYRVNI